MTVASRANGPVVSVTGAGGGIAQSLLTALVEEYSVKALFRDASETSRRWERTGCRIVLGDLRDRDVSSQLVDGAELVIHCAAKMMGFSPAEFEAVNVQGTRNLADAAVAARCRRFIHISSNTVYWAASPRSNGEFTEDLLLEENSSLDSYSRTKLRAETAVVEGCRGSETDYTVLRPSCVYGPNIQSWTLLPLEMIRKGRPLFIGFEEPEGLLDAVFVGDLVQGILLAAKSPKAAGEIFNIGSELVSFKDFYGYLGEIAGRSPRLGSEQKLRRISSILRAASRLSGAAAEIERGMQMALRMSRNRNAYPSRKAKALLDYAPQFSLPMGMLKTELWLREQEILPRQQHRIPSADRHYTLRPRALIRPTSEIQIVQAVREAGKRGLRLKAIGALHSFVPIPETDGICIILDHYTRVLSLDDTLVTVQAGITIEDLNAQLRKHKLALPIHGSHAAQTIAGAISTATHGGSCHHGTLADQVERIRLVRADGQVLELGPNDPAFHAAVVSLGLLGVLSTVTLRCVPEFFLESSAEITSLEELLRDFDSIQRKNEYVDLRFHPQTGQVEMLLMNRVDRPEATSAKFSQSRSPSKARRRIVSSVFRSLLKVLHATRSESLNASILRRAIGQTYQSGVERCHDALSFSDLSAGEPFPIDDLEFAVAYSDAKPVLRDLAAYFRKTRNFPRFFPVHIRCSKPGEHWLSPNYGRDVCWFEFWQYPPNPQLYADLGRLFEPYRARVHWGKLSALEPDYLKAQYERWNDFAKLRGDWDPGGMFLNASADRWFQ